MKSAKTNAMRMLERAGISYEALVYPCPEALDALRVAALLGEAPERVYKTLVTRGTDRAVYVCAVPAPASLDLKAAAAALGVKGLSLVRPEELFPLTGYVRGGCSPIGMKKPFPTLVDRAARGLPCLLVSGGRLGLQLRLKPEDLQRAVGFDYAWIAV